MTKRFGIKTKLLADPITMHLAQSITTPSLSIMVGVELFSLVENGHFATGP